MTMKRLESFQGLETVGCGRDCMSELIQLYIRGMNFVE